MSETVCSSAGILHVYIEEAKKQMMIPEYMHEIEDGTLVSDVDCTPCTIGSCIKNPIHLNWKQYWEGQGKPIPKEVITRGNTPHF
jgi:hypothetical protein